MIAELKYFLMTQKNEEDASFAIVIGEESHILKLPKESTISTVALYGTEAALKLTEQSPKKEFAIYSGSQSALQAVAHYAPMYPVVQQVREWTAKIHSKHKSDGLCWCPGHVGISGNEIAHAEAKSASSSNLDTWEILWEA